MAALTADPQFHGEPADYSQIEELCRRLGVPYHIRRTQLGRIIFEDRKEANPCSLCARMRRGILHNMAKEAGCNKLAGPSLRRRGGDLLHEPVQQRLSGLLFPKILSFPKGALLIRPLVFCGSASRGGGEPLPAAGGEKQAFSAFRSRSWGGIPPDTKACRQRS